MVDEQDELSKDVHDRIFREKILVEPNFTAATSQERPKLIILGGQPGAGKGRLAEQAALEMGDNVVTVDPDRLRDRHPLVDEFRREKPYEWSGRTHTDAGAWADELRLAAMAEKKNLIYDTTLSSGEWTMDVIDQAKARGYDIEIRVVAAHKLESELGVDKRFTEKLDLEGHARYVPEGARDVIYGRVPKSLGTIHANSDVPIRIFNREGVELYDSRADPRPPGQVLEEARFARLKDPAITQALREGWDEQVKWHRDLPEEVQHKPINDSQTRENLLEQHRGLNVQGGVVARAEGAATIDELTREGAPPARAPIPEPADPYPRLRGFNAGLAIEAGLTAYEWNETRQRAQVFQDTLQNDTAARDAYMRQGAQTTGALVGTAAGVTTAAALNVGTGGTAALVVGEGYLFGKAAEHGVELWQKHRIYNVTSEVVDWAFNGKQWIREDLRADLVDDGRSLSQQQDFAAPPDKARELSALASAEAVKQSLGAVPTPRDPFVQAAGDGGDPWTYQPDRDAWTREVATAYDINNNPSAKETVEAGIDQAAQLSAQAQRTIDQNLAAGPAEIAAQYQTGHKAHGYDQTPAGGMPPAVAIALNPDLLQASDGKHYQRDAQGEWAHDGQTANQQRALELELTRGRLAPALLDHQQQLANMPPWQPPTPEAQDKAFLREAYLNRGIDRDTRPEEFDASYLAVQRTRAETGVAAATLVLGQDASGQFTPNSPIHHLRRDADGVVQIAATTTPEDIAKALTDVRARGRGEDAPQQSSLGRTITQTTPEERDAREQAQREANRQGLSHDDAEQAVHAATVGASARMVTLGGADARAAVAEETPQTQRERGQDTPTAQDIPQAAAVTAIARDARNDDSARLQRELADAERNATERAAGEQVQADKTHKIDGKPPPPQTVAATLEGEASPAPERVATKIGTTATPERQPETATPHSADRDPPQAHMDAAPAPAATTSDALRLGGRGDDVELLQYRLDRQGYRGPDGAPIPQTGQYGPETVHAVRQFQTLHGIPATGIADQDTRDAVDRALAAQRERERGEPAGPNRSPSPESTPTSETPAPVIASRTVGLSASRSGDDTLEREAEHAARAEAQPAAPTATAPDPTLAHHATTRDARDDERKSPADPDRTQPATPESVQPAPTLMAQPGHPAHAMYTQALSLIEHGDVVPAGTMTQEEKSKLAAGVVAQFLSEDNRATHVDALYASKHNAPGMPATLIPVQGDPTTDYCRRASIDVGQAFQTPLEQSSTVAQTMVQAREQALAKEQAEEQARKERQETEGPVMRIGTRTPSPSMGPQGDGSGDGGGGGE